MLQIKIGRIDDTSLHIFEYIYVLISVIVNMFYQNYFLSFNKYPISQIKMGRIEDTLIHIFEYIYVLCISDWEYVITVLFPVVPKVPYVAH